MLRFQIHVVTRQKGIESIGQVLNEEKLDKIGDRLEHSPQTSIRYLAKEKGILKASA
jgi:hypothetical protein